MTRRHRIFIDQALHSQQTVTVTNERYHYLSRVLRVTVNQVVTLFNGDGMDYAAAVKYVERDAIKLQLGERLPACAESPLLITLVQAVSRGERMDVSLQKATELGASAFQPVFTARTEVRLSPDKLNARLAHWRKVIISACEQSGRARLPELRAPIAVSEWAQQSSPAMRLVLMPGSQPLSRISPGVAVELLVGPEGGFDEREVDLLGRHGVLAASLGPRILRTETAGPAAIAVVQALAGDLR